MTTTMTVKEASEILGVSTETIREMVAQQKIPNAFRMQRKGSSVWQYYIFRKDFLDWCGVDNKKDSSNGV